MALTLAICFGLARLGLAIGAPEGAATVWPATGFALAALVLFGTSLWPAVFVGLLLAQLTDKGLLGASMTIAVGTTLEAAVGAALVARFAEGARAFRSPLTICRFALIAILISSPIGAAFGAAAKVSTGGPFAWAAFGRLWQIWWLVNVGGVLVVAPTVTLWATESLQIKAWRRGVEGVGLLVTLAGVLYVVFGGRFSSGIKHYPLEFLCVPFLLWAAFRLRRRGVATAALLMASMSLWATRRGFGPFARESEFIALMLVQAYTAVMAITGLVLGAVVAEHSLAQEQLRELATTDSLTGLVNHRRLIDVLRGEIARSVRTRRSFAVLFLDMNGLKKINDRYGHLVGSQALARIAEALRQSCRTIDTPARYGGDEFAIVLPESDEQGGKLMLKRVSERLDVDVAGPPVSVSGGVAVFPRDGDSPTLLLLAADRLLYRAKLDAVAARKAATEVKSDTPRTGTLF